MKRKENLECAASTLAEEAERPGLLGCEEACSAAGQSWEGTASTGVTTGRPAWPGLSTRLRTRTPSTWERRREP